MRQKEQNAAQAAEALAASDHQDKNLLMEPKSSNHKSVRNFF